MAKIEQARFSFAELLRNSASALVLGAFAIAMPTQASAQDAGEADEDEIVVTGIRASLRSAQEIKRDSEVIVDSITAVDIGALPDRSVTEALQRVSGVAISRTPAARDPVRFAAEGSGVVIRGMTQVRGEFNGRDSFTANQGRGLSFEDVPPELMAGVDVYKNPSADIIEGGIGGTVNLRTRMPFDADGQVLAFSVDTSYGDFREEWAPSGSILYSNRWDTGIGEIGLLVDVAYSTLATRTDTLSLAPYYERCSPGAGHTCELPNGSFANNPITGQTAGASVFVPGAISWRALDWDRTREGYAVALQWAPTDTLEFYYQYLRSAATQESRESAAWSNANGNDVNVAPAGPAWEFDSEGNFVYGGLTGGATNPAQDGNWFGFGVDSRFAVRDSVTTDQSIGFRWDATDNLAINVDYQTIDATTDSFDFTAFDRIDFPSFTLDLRGDMPAIEFGGGSAYAEDPSNYFWSAAMDHHDDNEAEEQAIRADAVYTFDDNEWLRSFRVGVRHTERDLVNRESTWNWGFISEWWGGAPIANFDGSTTGGLASQNTHLYLFPNFMRGEAGLPSQLWFPTMSLVEQGPGTANPDTGAYAFIHQLQTAGWGWVPFGGDYENAAGFSYNADGTVSGLGGGVNTQNEETDAIYALLRLGGDNFFGSGLEWDGNVGVRYVETSVVADGFRSVASFPGSPPPAVPGDATFANGARTPISISHDYQNTLPSLNLRVHLTDEFQVRFAASRAISRPDFGQLMATEGIGVTTHTVDPTPGAPNSGDETLVVDQFTGSSGNPALNPMRADQYDIALEWYFNDTGNVYATFFYKDVYDYIANIPTVEAVTNNGVTRDVNFTRPRNVEKGIIHGYELGYQQFFDFLPEPLNGLGVQANFTFVDSMGGANVSASPFDSAQISNSLTPGLPLEGLSRTSYNVALLYEEGPLSARLAYNWRERYLLTTSQANDNNAAWFDDYGQLDGSIFYAITDHLKLGIEAANLTSETVYIQQQDFPGQHGHTLGSGTRLYPHHWIQADTRFTFVLRGSW